MRNILTIVAFLTMVSTAQAAETDEANAGKVVTLGIAATALVAFVPLVGVVFVACAARDSDAGDDFGTCFDAVREGRPTPHYGEGR